MKKNIQKLVHTHTHTLNYIFPNNCQSASFPLFFHRITFCPLFFLKIKRIVFLSVLFFLLSQNGYSQSTSYFKAKAYLSYALYDSAYFYINEAIKKEPDNYRYWQLKGNLLFAEKQWDGAINSYKEAEKHKRNIATYPLAKSYALTGNFEKAKEYLEAYLTQRNRIRTDKILSDTCFKEFSKTNIWQHLWEKDYNNAYQNILKQIEYNIHYEHYEDALEQIDDYLIKHPKKYYLYFLKGNILQKMNDNYAALSAYETAYKIKQKNTEIIYAYGDLLFRMKKFKKAKSVFLQLRNTDKYNILPLREIGKCNFELKKTEEALQDLSYFVQFYFNDSEANFYLAKIYLTKKKYFNALRYINKAIKKNPNSFIYLFTRGKIYLESQAYKLAKKDFLLALDISNTQSGKLYFLLGLCYQHMNDFSMACSYWKRAYLHKYMEANEYLLKFCQ